MKDKKGQALVEFVIIIPVFFMILFSAIDLGNIIYKKYSLESDLDYVVYLYRQEKFDEINLYATNNGFKVNITSNEDMVLIKLDKNIRINTPGMNLAIGNPYKISVDRVIYNEK